jgi:spermidine/putrescine transport system permease protein
MLGGGKTDMIANTIANQFGQSRNWPFGAALSVFLIVITAIVVIITLKVGKRNGQKVDLV